MELICLLKGNHNNRKNRTWANAKRNGRPAEYTWRPVLNAAKFGSHPLLDCRAVTLPIGERKTWRTQSEFRTWQNSVTEQQSLKMYIYSNSPGKGQTLSKVWLASAEQRRCSNEANMQKPLKLAGVPQTNEMISATSRLKFTILWDMWRRYCCLTGYFPIVDMWLTWEDIARQSCAMASRWRFFASCISSSHVQYISDLHSKFAVGPHHVWRYGRHPTCDGWD